MLSPALQEKLMQASARLERQTKILTPAGMTLQVRPEV